MYKSTDFIIKLNLKEENPKKHQYQVELLKKALDSEFGNS